jgi:hypothetical protein
MVIPDQFCRSCLARLERLFHKFAGRSPVPFEFASTIRPPVPRSAVTHLAEKLNCCAYYCCMGKPDGVAQKTKYLGLDLGHIHFSQHELNTALTSSCAFLHTRSAPTFILQPVHITSSSSQLATFSIYNNRIIATFIKHASEV